MERVVGLGGLTGWDERTGVKLAIVAEAPLKPNTELASDLELEQGLAVLVDVFVDRCVARPAQAVEQVPLGDADDVALVEPVDELLLLLSGAPVEPDLCRGALGEHFAEAAELVERHIGVGCEVLFGLGPEGDKALVVVGEVGEVGGGGCAHGAPTGESTLYPLIGSRGAVASCRRGDLRSCTSSVRGILGALCGAARAPWHSSLLCLPKMSRRSDKRPGLEGVLFTHEVKPVARVEESPNQSLDRYRLIARLGTGGMADVFLAVRHGPVGFQRLLVVKRLRANLMGDATFEGMLLAEARLAARLHHPNIVQTFEVGQDGKCPYIVMEYLDGQPLHRIAQAARSNPAVLDPVAAATIVAEALSGLHYAHELANYDGAPLKIIHRDISPQNLFLTYDGEVKLVDFGIAKASLDEVATEVGVMKGKLTYMSPEQTRSAPLDRRTDIFAMGVVLWELLANRRLFAFDSPVDTLAAIAGASRPNASGFVPAVAAELDSVCRRALDPDPDHRFQTAAEMRDAIEDFLEHSRYRITRRDVLGRRLREHFSDERARMDQRIQACMSIARDEVAYDAPSTGSIPILHFDEQAFGEDTTGGAKTRVDSTKREHTTTAPIPLTQVRTRPPSVEPGAQSWRSTYLLAFGAIVGVGALSLMVLDRSRDRKVESAAVSPLPTAAMGASDVLLRLRGSNTIGASLAPP